MVCSVSANYGIFERLVAVTINKSTEMEFCIEENNVLRYKEHAHCNGLKS